jgi:hypothetical protein
MDNLIYHSVEPEDNRDSFSEFDTVSFKIVGDRNLVANSVRLEGELQINSTGNTRAVYTDHLHLNKRIGAHALLQNVTTEINGKKIESFKRNYPRFVNMTQTATKSPDDYYSARELCELKAPTTDSAIAYSCGHQDVSDAIVIRNLDFSFKPLIALNRMDGDLPLARVNNEVQIHLNLNRNEAAIQGIGQTANANYSIVNLRLTYITKPPAPNPVVQMQSVTEIQSTLQSSNANISTRVPAVCKGVSISFLKSIKENALGLDNHALEKPPLIDSVQFLFNDATNKLQQYTQDDYGELMDGYLESLESNGIHNVRPETVKGNSAFGMGLNFNQEVDLSNQKFSVQIQSGVSSTNQYIMYQFFHSVISV